MFRESFVRTQTSIHKTCEPSTLTHAWCLLQLARSAASTTVQQTIAYQATTLTEEERPIIEASRQRAIQIQAAKISILPTTESLPRAEQQGSPSRTFEGQTSTTAVSNPMMSLTTEQQKRIEANRQKALQKQAAKPGNVTLQAPLTVEQKQRIEANRQRALEKAQAAKLQESAKTEMAGTAEQAPEIENTHQSACFVAQKATTTNSNSHATPLTEVQKHPIKDNRQRGPQQQATTPLEITPQKPLRAEQMQRGTGANSQRSLAPANITRQTTPLTTEQKMRIEANRQRALEKVEVAKMSSTIKSSSPIITEQAPWVEADHNTTSFVEQAATTATTTSHHATLFTAEENNRIEINRQSALQTKVATSVTNPIAPQSALTAEQKQRIELNRQKAIQRQTSKSITVIPHSPLTAGQNQRSDKANRQKALHFQTTESVAAVTPHSSLMTDRIGANDQSALQLPASMTPRTTTPEPPLTNEQMQRIEANRQRAYQLQGAMHVKERSPPHHKVPHLEDSTPRSSSAQTQLSSEQRQRTEANRKRALKLREVSRKKSCTMW